MKAILVVVIIGALVSVAYVSATLDRRAQRPTTPSTVKSPAASAGPGPDRSWAELFDALNRQWSEEGKSRVEAASPGAQTVPAATNPGQ